MARLPAFSDWFLKHGPRYRFLVAILLGVLIGMGQAPWSMSTVGFLGLLLAILAFQRVEFAKQAAMFGWAIGVGYFGVTLFWIVEPFLVDAARHGWMAPFALALMVGGMALFWALGFGVAARIGQTEGQRLVALIACLGLAEMLRSYVFTGFPWGLLGYMWLDTPFAQLAALVGPHGLGALTLIVAVALAWRFWVGLVLAAALVMLSLAIAPKPEADHATAKEVRLRLIQPNAPQNEKWDPRFIQRFYERQLAYTAAKPEAPLDLIIWPEAAITLWLDEDIDAQQRITASAGGATIVLGARRYEGRRFYNSLAVLGKTGLSSQIYDKRHLVPFGEYIPFGNVLSRFGIHGLASAEGGGFSSGSKATLMDFGSAGRALPLICYEASFPHLSHISGPRPDWILQLTNDAWFGNFAGPQQHLAQARMRAIEQGLPLVRVANTGVSAVIDARGEIMAQLGLGKPGYLDAVLPGKARATLFARTGDWLILVLLFGLLAAVMARRFRNSH